MEKKFLYILLALVIVVIASAFTTAEAAEDGYNVVLINNFMGNTWRPLMERSAQLLSQEGPLADKIASFRIINTENSPTAQNQAINSLILEGKTDMIMMIAASPTASNQEVRAACDAGIVFVSYDVFVEEPCAWKIGTDWEKAGRTWARWLIDQVGEDAIIFHDLGQSGASSSRDMIKGNKEILDQYPNLKIYTYYGEFAQGTEQAQVATLLAAHPEVDGILGHGYGANALYALEQGGAEPVPVTGFAYNESLIACDDYKAPCLLKGNAAYVSGEAMKLGIQVLEGEVTGEPRFIEMNLPYFTDTEGVDFVEEGDEVFSIKEYANREIPGGLPNPLSPSWWEFDLDAILAPPELD